MTSALALGLLSSALAWAQEPPCLSSRVTQAKQDYERADFRAVQRDVDAALRCQDGTPEELTEVLRWRAQAYAAVGDRHAAEQAFAVLSTVAPGYALDPYVSPKVTEVFRTGKALARSKGLLFARLVQGKPPDEEARGEVYGPVGEGQVMFRFWVAGSPSDVLSTRIGEHLYAGGIPSAASGEYALVVRRGGDTLTQTLAAALPVRVSKVEPARLDDAVAPGEPVAPKASTLVPPPPATDALRATPEAARAPAPSRLRVLVPGIGGVVLVGVSAVAYAEALGVHHRLVSLDPGVAADGVNNVVQTGKTEQVVAFAAGGAGIACLGVAAFLWWRSPPAEVAVAPALGPAGAGIRASVRF